MHTARRKICSSSSARYSALCRSAATLCACAPLPSSATPQPAAMPDGLDVLRRADLIKRQHIRPHGAQEHHAAGRLLPAGHHVRICPDVKLRRAVLHGRDLAPLVHERDACAHIGQAAHTLAQQRRLPVAGRREDERTAKPIAEQLRQKRIGTAGHRVRDAHRHGAQLPDAVDLPGSLSVSAAAKPDAAAARPSVSTPAGSVLQPRKRTLPSRARADSPDHPPEWRGIPPDIHASASAARAPGRCGSRSLPRVPAGRAACAQWPVPAPAGTAPAPDL